MPAWTTAMIEPLWRNAWMVIPLAAVVAAICRWLPCRATTRHALWLAILLWLVVAPMLPTPPGILPAARIDDQPPHPTNRQAAKKTNRRVNTALAVRSTERGPSPTPRLAHRAQTTDIALPRKVTPRPTPPRTVARFALRAPKWLALATGPGGHLSIFLHAGLSFIDRPTDAFAALPVRTSNTQRNEPAPPATESRDSFKPNLTPRAHAAASPHTFDDTPPIVADIGPRRDARLPTKNASGRHRRTATTRFDRPSHTPTSPTIDTAKSVAPIIAQPDDNHADDGADVVGTTSRLQPWYDGLRRLIAAILALPPIPLVVWIGGAALLAACQITCSLRFGRWLGNVRPADKRLRRQVRIIGARIGLRRMPDVVLSDARISPMICFAGRPRLVLPAELWTHLDETGRRAVICHELAHLRRRDHWVAWVDRVVGGIYWWHPLVWWIRRRIHEEADACCDAWVTWLLPRGRRAYAEALLATRAFLGVEPTPAPPNGMTMFHGRAKRLARRIRMVMTRHETPRMSFSGLVLGLAVLAAAWLASPAKSAPPEDPGEAHQHGSTVQHQAQAAPSPVGPAFTSDQPSRPAAVAQYAPQHATAPAAPSVAYSASLLATTADDDDEDEVEARLERLEKQMQRLLERLEAEHDGPSAPRGIAPPMPEGRLFGVPRPVPTIRRAYELPEGRLEALTKLMIRDDVPIRISPQGDRIEVIATPQQHAIFEAFVNLLTDPQQEEVRAYHLSEGKLQDLTDLMARSDVPVVISRDDHAVRVHGPPAVQAIFKAFVDMIDPPPHAGAMRSPLPQDTARQYGDLAKRARRQALEAQQRATESELRRALESSKQLRQKIRELHQHIDQHKPLRDEDQRRSQAERKALISAYVAEAMQLKQHAKQREREADRLHDRAAALEEEASVLRREEAHLLAVATATTDPAELTGLEQQVAQIRAALERIGLQADELHTQADRLELEAAVLAKETEALRRSVVKELVPDRKERALLHLLDSLGLVNLFDVGELVPDRKKRVRSEEDVDDD